MSAASDPFVASTLADPPYITEVVMTEDVELTVFLDATWNGRSVVTGYVCTGASVWVFTGEVLVISDLVAGHAYWFQCAARTAAKFSPFSTKSQMVTAKTPPTAASLPLPLSSRSNGRDGGGVNSCQLFLRVHNFDCVWCLDLTVGKYFTNWALDVCGSSSASEERAQWWDERGGL